MTTISSSTKVQLLKCLSLLRRSEFKECKEAFEKLKLNSKENASRLEQYVVFNNSLVCDGIIHLNTNCNHDTGEHITEGFDKLLEKITDCAVDHEEYLTLQLVVASNLIAWCISQNDTTARSVEKCTKVWECCLKQTNLYVKYKTKKMWKQVEVITPEVFTHLDGYTCCSLYCCACLVAMMYVISMDYAKGKSILKSLDGICLKELPKSQNYLSFLNVSELISGNSCVHLNTVCEDLFRQSRAIMSLLEKDIQQSVCYFHKISTKEWKPICSYIAAFLLYETSDDRSEVTRILQNILTYDSNVLDAHLKARVYNLLGCVLSKERKPYMAVEHFKQALSADELFLVPLYNIAIQYRKLELQNAELDTLELLCKHLKNRSPHGSPIFFRRSLMLYPILRLVDKLDDGMAYFPVYLKMARRYLQLHRYGIAAEKYLALLAALIQTPLLTSIVENNLPCVQHMFHETAFALLKSDRYSEALVVCQQAIDAYVPSVPSTSVAAKVTCTSNESVQSSQTSRTLQSKSGDQTFSVKSCNPVKDNALSSQSLKRLKPCDEQEGNSCLKRNDGDELNYLLEDVLALAVKAHAHFELGEEEESFRATNRILTCLSESHTVVSSRNMDGMQPQAKRPRLELENPECPLKISIHQLKAHIHSFKAVIQSQRNYLDDAYHNLRLALQLAPEDPSVWYNYTLLMTKMRRQDEGFRSWLRFRQNCPSRSASDSQCVQHFTTKISEEDFLKLDSLAKKHMKSHSK